MKTGRKKSKLITRRDIEKTDNQTIDALGVPVEFLSHVELKDGKEFTVNLGEDADTVVGGIVDIYYGKEAIPEEWTVELNEKIF